MIMVQLSIRSEREPIAWPVEQLTEHFALCPGLERDATGEWHYVPRWWFLCHVWTNEFGEPEARTIMAVEQELPRSGLIDRPSLAIDPEQVRAFAAWLEHHHDWAARAASVDLAVLPSEIRGEMDKFYVAPNLWEAPPRGSLLPPRDLDPPATRRPPSAPDHTSR